MSIKTKAIAHYNRMIAWVEKQDLTKHPNSYTMLWAIGEAWYADDCPYCNPDGLDRSKFHDCKRCNLMTPDADDQCDCCGGYWYKMFRAMSWKEWLAHANVIKAFIERRG